MVPIVNDNHVQKIALQKTSVDSDEVKKYEQQTEKENINFLDKEIKDTWKFVMTERMTSNGIQQSKEKIKSIRGRIEKLNIIDKNEAVLVEMIDDIFIKLDKTKFTSFKRVACCSE